MESIAVANNSNSELCRLIKTKKAIKTGGIIIHSCENIRNFLLSIISARIPKGSDKSIVGKKSVVWTSESINALPFVQLIIREVATIFCIQKAIVERDVPTQKILKLKTLRGLHMDKDDLFVIFDISVFR